MSRIFIGRLSRSARERDVERLVDRYGRICDLVMKDGFCFVQFNDERDARDAVRNLDGRDFMGDRLLVEYARSGRGAPPPSYSSRSSERDRRPLRRTEHAVTVENLSSRASWQDLKDLMREAVGEVTFVDAHKPREGEGIVEFATAEDMRTAIRKLDDTEFKGRRIRVVEARRDRSRSRSRERGRDRSRERERSRSRSRDRRSPKAEEAEGRPAESDAVQSAPAEPAEEKDRSEDDGHKDRIPGGDDDA
eukprot:Opistho-1_new@63717